jgi:arylsulfatase A-like enzyme
MAGLSRRDFLRFAAAGSMLGMPGVMAQAVPSRDSGPNVVLIVVDDLNDYVTGMGGHPQAHTPNLARLAAQGVSFRRAYSNNPICAPSRASFLSGLYPHTSGLTNFGRWFENETIINCNTLPEYFGENGYRTLGTGKLFHHWRPNIWEVNGLRANYGPFAWNGKEAVGHPSVPEPFRSIGAVDGTFAAFSDVPIVPPTDDAPGHAGWVDKPVWNEVRELRYVSEDDRDPMPDERCTQWAVDHLRRMSAQPQDRPFLLAVGYLRPHTPLVAPKRFFDMFPLADLQLPVIRAGDKEDTHYLDVYGEDTKGPLYYRLLKESYPTVEDGLRAFAQAYLACVAFVDGEIGKVVDAVDASPFRDNTVIVVTSDHGYQMGQKDYLFKNSLWEESGRVPLIFRGPGIARGGVVEQPVSLIDIYPTLNDLCGLEGETLKSEKGAPLDGCSLRPFLVDPVNGTWDGPQAALTVINAAMRRPDNVGQQNYSVRSRRWRYIRYNNGAEELYDHDADPYEWTNVAGDARYREVKASLKAQLLRMTGR